MMPDKIPNKQKPALNKKSWFSREIKFGEWLFFTYRWHSVNLIPNFSRVSVCDDGENGYKICACWLSLTVFGLIFNVQYPTTKQHLFFTSPAVGPHWDRFFKEWYIPSTAKEREELYGKHEQ